MPTPLDPPSDEADGPAVPSRHRAVAGRARTLANVVVLLALVGVVITVLGVANQLTQPGGTVAVSVSDPTVLELDVAGLPAGTHLDLAAARDGIVTSGSDASVSMGLVVDDLPAWLRALTETPALVGALLIAGAAFLLRALLLDVAAGRPFANANVTRLRGIAAVVVAVAVVPSALSSGVTIAALEHLDHDGAGSPFGFTVLNLPLTPLVGAALLFLVAEVVRYGGQLVEDVEGLV